MLGKAVALWAASLVFALASCGFETVCDEAVNKMVSECELGDGAAVGPPGSRCEDNVECNAECVLDNDCDDITRPAGEGSYHECVADCGAAPVP
jgi:hypothetical protein